MSDYLLREQSFDLKDVDLKLLQQSLKAYQTRLSHLRAPGGIEEANIDEATVIMGDEFQNLLQRVQGHGFRVKFSIARDTVEEDTRNVEVSRLKNYAQQNGDRYVLTAEARTSGEPRRHQSPRVAVLSGRGVIAFSDYSGGFAWLPAELVNIEGVEPKVQ